MPSRTLRPGYTQWISEAFFKDENSEPCVWHHGTDAEPFNVFTRWEDASIGFHFGSRNTASERLRMISNATEQIDGGTIIPVLCRAARPLRLCDHHTWSQDNIARSLFSAGVLKTEEEVDFVIDSCRDTMIFAALEAAGYDAIIYTNETEGEDQDSILIWRAELLKSPDAVSFDLDDPRLYPQKTAPDPDLKRWEVLSDEIATDADDLYSFRCCPEAWFKDADGLSP